MSRVARRYAKAIFALATEEQQIEAVGEQLRSVAEVFQVPELASMLAGPLLSAERGRSLVDAVGEQLALAALAVRFLRLLADRARLDEVPSIAGEYRRLEDRALGRVRMRIRSAVPLADDQTERVVAMFERALGLTVIPHVEVHASLVAGLVVEVEGKVYDGSVRTQLERLAKRVAGAEIRS